MNFNSKKPKLNDDGVMYFLDNKLKNYNIKKNKKINNTYNLFLLVGFICLIGSILYYKYHNSIDKQKKHVILLILSIYKKKYHVIFILLTRYYYVKEST